MALKLVKPVLRLCWLQILGVEKLTQGANHSWPAKLPAKVIRHYLKGNNNSRLFHFTHSPFNILYLNFQVQKKLPATHISSQPAWEHLVELVKADLIAAKLFSFTLLSFHPLMKWAEFVSFLKMSVKVHWPTFLMCTGEFEDVHRNFMFVTRFSIEGVLITFYFCVFRMWSILNSLIAELCYTNKLNWLNSALDGNKAATRAAVSCTKSDWISN